MPKPPQACHPADAGSARRESSFRSYSVAAAASSTRLGRQPSRHAPLLLIRYVTDRAERTRGDESLQSLSCYAVTRRAPNGVIRLTRLRLRGEQVGKFAVMPPDIGSGFDIAVIVLNVASKRIDDLRR